MIMRFKGVPTCSKAVFTPQNFPNPRLHSLDKVDPRDLVQGACEQTRDQHKKILVASSSTSSG
jgi:hypothetical protein